MKKVILMHGWNTKAEYYDPDKPTASNDHWFPWLTKQLMMKDIHTIAPEMPRGYEPNYLIWKKEFERYEVNSETVLVGHSCGGGFLVRWLSENKTNVDKVFLIAPWMGIDFGEKFDAKFFDFMIDKNIAKNTKGLSVLYSDDDFSAIQESVNLLKNSLVGVRYIEFQSKGHFTRTSLRTEAFPELLEEILA